MADKLKIFLVGGDEKRNRTPLEKLERKVDIIDHIPQGKNSFKATAVRDAQVIVVVTDFVSNSLWEAARWVKKNVNGEAIPLVQARTVNHVVPELRKHQRFAPYLPDEKRVVQKKEEPVKEPALAPSSLGLSLETLWHNYGEKLTEHVKDNFKPGQKFHEQDLSRILSEAVGLPPKDVCELLPELAMRGILGSPLPQTWRVPSTDGEYVEDNEPAPAPPPPPEPEPQVSVKAEEIKDEAHMLRLAEIISGLPPGPYESLAEIIRTAKRCPEFRMHSGEELKNFYGYQVIYFAKDLDVIEEVPDGKWTIKTNPNVKVVLVDDKPPVVPKNPAKPTFEERMAKVARQEESAKDPTGLSISFPEGVRRSFEGGFIPALGSFRQGMEVLKAHLPEKWWNELAVIMIARKMKSNSGEPSKFMAFKGEFSAAEWDGLAWEALKEMPPKVWAQLLHKPEDLALTCAECGNKFVFNLQEQAFFKEKFGDGAAPRRCKECRAAKKRELPI